MIVLKYDVIKKSCGINYYFGIFWKILCCTTFMQNFIAKASLVQDLWTGDPLAAAPQVI